MENLLQIKINTRFPNEEIEVLEYNTMKTPAKVKCKKCNTEYQLAAAESFIREGKACICRRCINNNSGGRYTIEQFQELINQKYPQEDLTVLKYETTAKPVTIRCNTCCEEFTLQNGSSFLIKDKQRVCKKCLPNKRRFLAASEQNFYAFITSIQSNFLLVQSLEDIKNSSELVACECKKCKKINYKTMSDYRRGRGCQCTANNKKLTIEEVQEEMPIDFKVMQIDGGRGKMLIRHSKCNFIFSRTRQNNRKILCPKCDASLSKGEKAIINFLEENSIYYINEYSVELSNHKLRFDFYLPDLDRYIEFQGIQHYQPVEYFGGEERFKKQQEYDNLKREYCKEKMIEIPYTDLENIETILTNHLLKFND